MTANQTINSRRFISRLRNTIWTLGIPSWIVGITDRGLASFADGYLSAIDLTQLFITFFLFVNWLSLKPEPNLANEDNSRRIDASYGKRDMALSPATARMFELQKQHMISQEYLLPFSFVCQIYHLLNLKHLETIHAFSLNNLRIVKVTDFQSTEIGGIIKFQTVLDSPFNVLRIWRFPIVEVALILHTPYTVELSIPVYNSKKIVVMFNALPVTEKEHRLFIDIYSNLKWSKPLLQILLHFASCLTLFEDLSYLRQLSRKKFSSLINLNRVSDRETMRLFRRFVELYGSTVEPSQLTESHESTA